MNNVKPSLEGIWQYLVLRKLATFLIKHTEGCDKTTRRKRCVSQCPRHIGRLRQELMSQDRAISTVLPGCFALQRPSSGCEYGQSLMKERRVRDAEKTTKVVEHVTSITLCTLALRLWPYNLSLRYSSMQHGFDIICITVNSLISHIWNLYFCLSCSSKNKIPLENYRHLASMFRGFPVKQCF